MPDLPQFSPQQAITPETIVFSLQQILTRELPVLQVSHHADGSWNFTSGKSFDVDDLVEVPFASILAIDAGLASQTNLPPDWIATRPYPGGSWRRWWIYQDTPGDDEQD